MRKEEFVVAMQRTASTLHAGRFRWPAVESGYKSPTSRLQRLQTGGEGVSSTAGIVGSKGFDFNHARWR